MFRRIDDSISVASQITPGDCAAAARLGFVMIVNNRPDGEEPGQPDGAAIEAAAHAAGLAYRAIPITHAGFTEEQVEDMYAALHQADGPVLAFCRSGTRSTYAWALAQAADNVPADLIIAKARAAGYDIEALRPHLEG